MELVFFQLVTVPLSKFNKTFSQVTFRGNVIMGTTIHATQVFVMLVVPLRERVKLILDLEDVLVRS